MTPYVSVAPQDRKGNLFGSLRDLDGNPPPLLSQHPTGELRFHLTDAIRRLNELLLTTDATAAEIEKVADAVDAAVEQLSDRPRREPELWEYNQTVGLLNVLTPPLRADPDPDDPTLFRCRGTFTKANEGVYGTVHGGLLAMVFDHCAGTAAALVGKPGVTGTLNIRFERPCPIYTELTFFAKTTRIEGRKVFVEGGVLIEDQTCVRFEALMIEPR